jgi:hypothetical protein
MALAMGSVSRSLVRRFEIAIATCFLQLGLDTSKFVVIAEDGEPVFRQGGSPGEWRSNVDEALKVLYEFDQRNSEKPWNIVAKGAPLREAMLSVVNAMKRSDDAALGRIMRYAVAEWGPKEPNLRL